MANVHRWGADDWIDRNGVVREGGEGEGGKEGGKKGGKVKFRRGAVVVVAAAAAKGCRGMP